MCIGRSSVDVASDQRINMDEKSSSQRHDVIPRLNIYQNLSRWVRRRSYQRLSKVPDRSHNLRIRVHPSAALRRAESINPRLRMVPGIHIRIISPVSLLLRLRDVYSRKVSVILTTTTTSSSKAKKKQQHASAEVVDEVRVKLPSVRELLAAEGL